MITIIYEKGDCMIINKKLYRNFILNRIFANTDLISPNDGYKNR